MAQHPNKPDNLAGFKKAVQISVEGEPVVLQSVKSPDGEEYHITPRKFSKKNAAKIRGMLIESSHDIPAPLQAKMRRIRKDHPEDMTEEVIEAALTDEEMAELSSVNDPNEKYEIEHAKIIYGIALQDFSDPPGPMSGDIADLVLEAPLVADELLKIVDDLNPPFVEKSSESSGT